MRMIEYLYAGMLVTSLVLIYFANRQYVATKELITTGTKTTAVVIDLIEVSSEDGDTYKPVFVFTDRANTKITFESEISTSPSPYSIGDKVNIIYDNDERKIISFWGLYRWTIILLSIVSPLLIIGGGYLLYSRL